MERMLFNLILVQFAVIASILTVVGCLQPATLQWREEQVEISQGALKGKIMTCRTNLPFAGYLRIPYAEPPVGPLRLKPPVPAGGWSGVRDATRDGPPCIQQKTKNNVTVIVGDENCLHLNVYTPHNVRSRDKIYPVMVFIHGGSMTSGNSSSYSFGPQYLLNEDIVLVTINYRLGLLGFLSWEDKVLAGNFGLKDQSLALKWVKNNIEKFGGDPNSITVFGQSAGSVSTALHLISPLSKGLFQRIITESGSCNNFWSVSHPGDKRNEAFLFALTTSCLRFSVQSTLNCLQNLPVEKFFLSPFHDFVKSLLTLPYDLGIVQEPEDTEEAFLTSNPWEEIVKPNNVTWLMGINSADGTWATEVIYSSSSVFIKIIDTLSELVFPYLFGYFYTAGWAQQNRITKTVKEFYFKFKPMDKASAEFTELATDRAFLQPALDSVRLYPGTKYFYYYDHRNEFRLEEDRFNNRPTIGMKVLALLFVLAGIYFDLLFSYLPTIIRK